MVDYYAVLGVPRDASEAEIKTAHRRLAREWHSDVNDSPEAAERFQLVHEAKDVLLDPEQRAEHDRRLDGSDVDDEWTPTVVTVEPECIDFGVLEAGGPAVETEILLSWEGAAPGMVRPGSRAGDWWELFHVEVRGTNAIAFSVRAQAYDGLSGGRHTTQLDLMSDADVYSVELIMMVAGVPRMAADDGGGGTSSGDWDDPDDWGRPVAALGDLDIGAIIGRLRDVLPNGWLLAVVAFVLIFGVLHAGWPVGHAAPQVNTAVGAAQTATSAVAKARPKLSRKSLPKWASSAFKVRPGFRTAGTLTTTALDMSAEQYRLILTATAVGFTVVVRVRAAYDPADDYYVQPDAARTVVVGPSCLDIAVQDDWQQQTEQEPALSTNLSESAGLVTGTMVYAAVLPGRYGFDLQCLGVTGRADWPITIGSVTTPNVGVAEGKFLDSQGYADYSAMTVFSVRKARHDTVLVFGQVGPTDSARPPGASCVELQSGRKLYPAATSVHVDGAGDGQAYALGTQTYNVPGSRFSGADFFYNCAAGMSQDYVRLP